MTTRAIAAILAYIATATAANLLTTWLPAVPLGLGLTATAGTFAAGAALSARDAVDDHAGTRWLAGSVAVGALLSAVTAGPGIASASGAAFATSETLDTLVYRPLRRRGHLAAAVLASNTAGALVDSVVFIAVAGFPLTPQTLAGQMLVKTGVTVGVLAARSARRGRR